jgi:hypothetical protein
MSHSVDPSGDIPRPREVLPIPDRPIPRLTTYAATDTHDAPPPIERLRPPAGAPNVLIILLDDVGFGASSAFGGPVHTATAERLAGEGLRYTRFHTAVRADTSCFAVGPQPPLGGIRQYHRDSNISTWIQHDTTEHQGDPAGDASVERILDGDVR